MTSLARPAALVFERLTPTGLHRYPSGLTWEQDRRFGLALVGIGKALPWALVDWMGLMEGKYGEKAPQLYEEAGLGDARTGVNRLRLFAIFPPTRRRASLPLSFHEEVAALEPKEQDRWLDQAEKENWTREQLRQALGKGRKALEVKCPPHRCSCGATWGEGMKERGTR